MTKAVLDAGRGTLTLPRRLVPVAMLLRHRGHVGDDVSSRRAVRELERAGIASDGRLHPMAAEMLATVTQPGVVITVEVVAVGPPEISTVWAGGGRVVLGRPVEPDLFELGPLDASLLPFHLAQLTRVGIRPDPPFAGSVSVPAVLATELETPNTIDVDRLVRCLRDAGVVQPWADRLAIAHHHRRCSWRVASLWTTSDGSARDAELRVLDAGPAGYWAITPGSDGPSRAVVSVVTSSDVIVALRKAIPPGWEDGAGPRPDR